MRLTGTTLLLAACGVHGSTQVSLGHNLAMQPAGLAIELLAAMDVVDAMRLAGHGHGLDEERLVHVFGEDTARTMTEGDKLRLKKAGYSFMDITDQPQLGALNAQRAAVSSGFVLTEDSVRQKAVRAMIDELDDTHLRADIAKLSSFWTRNYRSDYGRTSSDWVFEHVSEILASTPNNATVTSVRRFEHPFPQSSVIARIARANDAEGAALVILGAHQDSLNYLLPFYRAPGADDDGSGSVTHMQTLRSLVEHSFVPPPGVAIEVHWYAAEEGGLLGSQDIAAAYEREGRTVKGMLQMDMTAFVKRGTTPIVGFFGDQVDGNLTSFATALVDAYVPLPWRMTGCGRSCGSDHMSWTKAGFRAAFATESLFRDAPTGSIHTAKDDTDQDGQYSFEHMLQFVKLGIAFAVELSAA